MKTGVLSTLSRFNQSVCVCVCVWGGGGGAVRFRPIQPVRGGGAVRFRPIQPVGAVHLRLSMFKKGYLHGYIGNHVATCML